MAAPIITIGTPSATKISAISGHDQATVVFHADMPLNNWEARATYQGQTIGHGSGLLVESGGSLAANTNATVYVDDEELTEGDREYTITVFGHGSDGYWSDGTYEAVNVLDYDRYIAGSGSTFSNGTIVQDTGSSNQDYSKIYIETSKNWAYVDELAQFETTGNKIVQITIDSSIDMFRIGFFGDSNYTSIYFDTYYIEDGNYIISLNIEELLLNHAVISGLSVTKAVI